MKMEQRRGSHHMKRGVPSDSDAWPQALDVLPRLGKVAEEERFASPRELLQQVADTPVDQLGADLRGELMEGEDKQTRVLLGSFFGATLRCVPLKSESGLASARATWRGKVRFCMRVAQVVV